MTNLEKVLKVIRDRPDGLDDDEIAEITGIQPRQQIHQICSRLAGRGSIRRESIEKPGKRRKIHNFPLAPSSDSAFPSEVSLSSEPTWRRRLRALVAATAR